MAKLAERITFDHNRGELKIKDKLRNEFTFKVLPKEFVGVEEGEVIWILQGLSMRLLSRPP